jgi:hypothetical protein
MKRFEVSISGICPILQARHPSPEEEKLIAKKLGAAGSKIKTKGLTDEEQFDIHAYKTEKGEFYQPSNMIEACMTKAAVQFKFEGKKTFKDLISSGIIVSPVEIVHKNQNVKSDGVWGVNKNTRGAVWVVRPRFDEWQLDFEITLIQDERVSDSVLKEILEYAGWAVGIGAWRPKFGRFEVRKFKEIVK